MKEGEIMTTDSPKGTWQITDLDNGAVLWCGAPDTSAFYQQWQPWISHYAQDIDATKKLLTDVEKVVAARKSQPHEPAPEHYIAIHPELAPEDVQATMERIYRQGKIHGVHLTTIDENHA